MLQDVLSVAGAVLQFAKQLEHFFGNADNTDFTGGVFAGSPPIMSIRIQPSCA